MRLSSPRSKANSRRERANRRRWDLEEADAVGRPVGGEGLADEPIAGYGSPVTAVVACPTVVAHHEVMVGRDGDRLGQIASSAVAAGQRVGLVLLDHAVDDRVPVANREGVAGPGDEPLDEVLVRAFGGWHGAGLVGGVRLPAFGAPAVGAGGRVEDDDVADR